MFQPDELNIRKQITNWISGSFGDNEFKYVVFFRIVFSFLHHPVQPSWMYLWLSAYCKCFFSPSFLIHTFICQDILLKLLLFAGAQKTYSSNCCKLLNTLHIENWFPHLRFWQSVERMKTDEFRWFCSLLQTR